MKTICLLFLLVILCTVTAHADDPVIKVMEGKVPIIIDGNWIYPPFTLVLTDDNITVNGFEYERRKEEKEVWKDPPDKEKDFFDWLVRTSLEEGWAVFDSGGTFEEAKKAMEKVIYEYTDGDTLKVLYSEGGFELRYYKVEKPLFISVPRMPREQAVSCRKGVLESRFKILIKFIESDYLVIKGCDYEHGISPGTQPYVLPKLERLSKSDSVDVDLDEAPIVIEGGPSPVRLSRNLILDLMHPKNK